jgi:hypothetical protein
MTTATGPDRPTPALLDAPLLNALAGRLQGPILHPSEEAQLIRNLSVETGLSGALIQRIWRELAGEQRRRLAAPAVAIHAGRAGGRIVDLARARFGTTARYMLADRPEIAMASARPPQGAAVIALAAEQPWWLRLLAEPDLHVFGVLPDVFGQGPRAALVVGPHRPEPTGSDETYLATDAAASPAAVIAALGEAGLAADLILDVGGLKLVAIAGYVQAHDPRIDAAPGRLKGIIGAAPVPFDL